VNSVLVQHLVLDGSLDARMANTLIEKQEVIEKALDRKMTVDVYGTPYVAPAVQTPSANGQSAPSARDFALVLTQQLPAVNTFH
jgi:hypothetical protein